MPIEADGAHMGASLAMMGLANQLDGGEGGGEDDQGVGEVYIRNNQTRSESDTHSGSSGMKNSSHARESRAGAMSWSNINLFQSNCKKMYGDDDSPSACLLACLLALPSI